MNHLILLYLELDFPGGSDGKASAYNAGDPGSIPGSGRSHAAGNGTHSSILAWKIPWTEEPNGLQSKVLQRIGHDGAIKYIRYQGICKTSLSI